MIRELVLLQKTGPTLQHTPRAQFKYIHLIDTMMNKRLCNNFPLPSFYETAVVNTAQYL